jgi:hypothetical protein
MIKEKKNLQVSLNTHNWRDNIGKTISNREFKKLKFEMMINDIWIDEIYIHCLFVGNRPIINMMNEFGFEVNKDIDFQTISKLLTDYNVETFKSLLREGYQLTNEMRHMINDYLDNEYVYYLPEFKDFINQEYISFSRLMKINKIKENINIKISRFKRNRN